MTADEQHHIDTYGLISLERTEKFDLLVQLILNQREALIVCGAKGIGKTTLLKTLKKNQEQQRAVCFFQETSLLSFGDIKKELILAIKAQGSMPDAESLENMLLFYAEHQQKIVLILDNAGQLPHGFIDKLIKYSLKYPAIRLVFALTKKELILKSKTDVSIDNCYFVEIPALERQVLGVFLKILSRPPEGLIAKNAINDKLLNKLHRQTKGNPGKIISELQKQANVWFKWQKGLVFSSCLMAGGTLVYLYKPVLEQNNLYKQFFVERSQKKVVENAQQNSSKLLIAPEIKITENKVIESENRLTEETNTTLNSQESHVVKSVAQIKKQRVVVDDRQWVLQQSPEKYTLQLMLTSKKIALLGVLEKYKRLQGSLKYVQVMRKNKRYYILLYGSFSTANAAQKIVKSLPRLFKQAWAKQFRAIQLEIKKPQ
jgi:DamX protein